VAKPPVLPKPDRWDATHGTYLTGRAYLDGADALAAEMEERWGADRLRLLVDVTLREKFDRQRYKLRQAVEGGTLEDVRREAQRMILALQTLDRAAEANGAEPIDSRCMEVAMADGTVLGIVPDETYAKLLAQEGRRLAVYTLEEIALLVATLPALGKAKEVWPGATVVKVRRNVSDPLDNIPHATGLDDPLNNDGAFS